MRRALVLLAISKLIFFVTSLSAQSIWLEQRQGITIAVEFLKPYFVDSNSSIATSVLFFSGRFSISETMTMVADLPISHHGYDDDFGIASFESTTIIGNPYIGAEIRKQAFPVFAELGFRLPLGPDSDDFYSGSRAIDVGNFTDPDRFEAFMLSGLTVAARLNYSSKIGSNVALHLRVGLSGGGSLDPEFGPNDFISLNYSAHLGYQVRQVSITGGLTGRYLLDGSTFHLQRYDRRGRTAHQVAVAASMGFGAVRPGVHFKVPVDDYLNDEIHFVLGLNLGIQLK